MTDSITKQKIDRLLRSLEMQEPATYELGTPQLVETDELRELVGLGRQIVPDLIERTKFETPKVVAYIVSVLIKLGDLRTSAVERVASYISGN